MKKEKFYITTPIYYASGNLHIGHCYTTVICDAIARFKRMSGYDVFYLTGSDEHGQKVEQKALEAGKTPQQFVDDIVADIKDLWALLNVSYDKFIRTTDVSHKATVQKIFDKLWDNGDLYKDEYEGWYCTPCESFWTESQLVDGKCPDCGREVKKTKEQSYFFRLSKYADRLIKLYEDNPDFISPKSRMNEMVNNFIKPGLRDLCVSRTSFKWGVPVSFDPKHVIYVWIDALTNYITALGYMSDDDSLYRKYWPADLHMVGKEIVRFHTIIWPALLMALDIPLPKKVYGHGWLLFGGDKMSKSKGNIADPKYLCDRYTVDAIRYYLLREVPFGNDGVYSTEMLVKRINQDLANTYGNLVSRTTAMINQYFDGVLPQCGDMEDLDLALKDVAENVLDNATKSIDALDAPAALEEIFRLFSSANKYIDDTAPWILNKEGNKARLSTVLYMLAESIRIGTVILQPFLVDTPSKVFEAMSIPLELTTFDSTKVFGQLKGGIRIAKLGGLFPRLDVEQELKTAEEYNAKQAIKTEEKATPQEEKKAEITFDDFMKIELKTGIVKACEKVAKSKKLLKSTIEIGQETRTIVSGIAEHYTPEEMVGKTVVVVTNLAPAKLCGVVSEGMILCADSVDGRVVIVSPEAAVASGMIVR